MTLNLYHIPRICVTKQRINICNLKNFPEMKKQEITTDRHGLETALYRAL